MATAKSKNLVTAPKDNKVALTPSDLWEEDGGMGQEGVTAQDCNIPIFKPDSKLPRMVNSVTGEVYDMNEGVYVILCAFEKVFVHWEDEGTGNNYPVRVYKNGETLPPTHTDPSGKTKKDYVIGVFNEYIEETHNQYILIVDKDCNILSQGLLYMKSTQLKYSKKINGLYSIKARNGRLPPRFLFLWHLKLEEEKRNGHKWNNLIFKWKGEIKNMATYEVAKAYAKAAKEVTLGTKQYAAGDDSPEEYEDNKSEIYEATEEERKQPSGQPF